MARLQVDVSTSFVTQSETRTSKSTAARDMVILIRYSWQISVNPNDFVAGPLLEQYASGYLEGKVQV